MVVVIAGPSPGSGEIAGSIARGLGADLIIADSKTFPDGESYVRVPQSLEGEEAVVVQTLSPPQDTSIIQAMLLADAALGAGARKAVLVAPYLAYSRQDRRFLDGEPVSVAVVLRALHSAGYSALYTVEVHKEASLAHFPGQARSISPYEYMARKVKVEGDILVLAPDLGAVRRAERLAKALGASYDYLVKHRDRITGEIVIEPKTIPAEGKTVILVDDIISTGGTLAKATKLLYQQGAREVYALVAHALLAGNALERLEEAGLRRLYAGNTLPRREHPLVEYIDLGPLIAEVLGSG